MKWDWFAGLLDRFGYFCQTKTKAINDYFCFQLGIHLAGWIEYYPTNSRRPYIGCKNCGTRKEWIS